MDWHYRSACQEPAIMPYAHAACCGWQYSGQQRQHARSYRQRYCAAGQPQARVHTHSFVKIEVSWPPPN
eukprot:7755937-Alexandrium_andersonii.AAC.1